MQIIKDITSPFYYETTLPENANITLVIKQVEIANKLAEKYKFKYVEFDILHRKITIEYTAKETNGVGCYTGVSRCGQNKDMEQVISKLIGLCNEEVKNRLNNK